MPLTPKQKALYGSLLGGAYGDALGLPYEGLSGKRGKQFFKNPKAFNLIPFSLNYGMVSDDTEHAVMTVQAWIATQNTVLTAQSKPSATILNNNVQKNPTQFADIFTKSLGWRLRLWLLALPAGIGMATGRALFRLWLFLPTSGVYSAGNGGAMRASVLGVLSDDIDQLKQIVHQSTTLTHTDPKAYYGALVIALCAWYARTYPKDHPQASNPALFDFIIIHLDDSESAIELKTTLTQAYQAQQTSISLNDFMYQIFGQKEVTGYMYQTVPAVWFAYLRYRHDPIAGFQCLIEAGGDVDTTCAIAGGIWGVQYGEVIQQSIKGTLIEPKLTPKLFYGLSQQIIDSKQDSVNLSDLEKVKRNQPLKFGGVITLTRNLIFLVIVLLHGFRRLLPP